MSSFVSESKIEDHDDSVESLLTFQYWQTGPPSDHLALHTAYVLFLALEWVGCDILKENELSRVNASFKLTEKCFWDLRKTLVLCAIDFFKNDFPRPENDIQVKWDEARKNRAGHLVARVGLCDLNDSPKVPSDLCMGFTYDVILTFLGFLWCLICIHSFLHLSPVDWYESVPLFGHKRAQENKK